jgi:hypothetical protein
MSIVFWFVDLRRSFGPIGDTAAATLIERKIALPW